jgi:hypothetical protein
MTLRQDQFIAKLPENGFNISKTARQVGYSEQSSRAGSLYNSLQKRIAEAFQPESVKAKILKAEKKFIKDSDNNNYARMIELQSKISGLSKDSTATQVNVNVNDTIAKLRANAPIDVT